MGNFKVGDTVKVVRAQSGAYGADDKIGVIIDTPKTDIKHSGLGYESDGIWIKEKDSKYGNGIWSIGAKAKLELIESAKPTNKFKVGDKVVSTKENDWVNVGTKGIVQENNITPYVRWESSKHFESNDVWALEQDNMELVDVSPSITITQKGNKTISVYKQGDKFIKSGTARYNPDDAKDGVPYSFEVGAKYAFERLFGIEKAVVVVEPIQFKKAKVGDKIKIVGIQLGGHTPKVEMEQELIVVRTQPDGVWTEKNYFYDKHEEYIILEDVKAVGYKEVSRQAQPGEYIKIVRESFIDDSYKIGDILKADRISKPSNCGVKIDINGHTACICNSKYVVLENYQPKAETPKLDLSTISNEDFWNELQRRLGGTFNAENN